MSSSSSINSTIVFHEKLGCCVVFPTTVCNGAGEQDKMQCIHRAVRQLSEARGGRQGPNARPRSLIDRTWSSTKKSKLSQNFGTLQPLLFGFRHFPLPSSPVMDVRCFFCPR